MKGFFAITKASLISSIKNPVNLSLGLGFPLILVALFSLIGSSSVNVTIGILPDTVLENPILSTLQGIETVTLITQVAEEELLEKLQKGELSAIVTLNAPEDSFLYEVGIQTSTAVPQTGQLATSILSGMIDSFNLEMIEEKDLLYHLESVEIIGREHQQIDFILPGAIGFALMFSGVFTLAIDLISMREKLVFKKIFATPISKLTFLGAEALSRLLVGTVQSIVVLLIGVAIFDFTLINGLTTFLSLLVVIILGQVAFQGLGILAASFSKNQDSIAAIGNIIAFPQLMLSGAFFSLETLPDWAQQLANIFPLTHVVSAMRDIAFEGALLTDLGFELLALSVSIIIIFTIGVKLFRWE